MRLVVLTIYFLGITSLPNINVASTIRGRFRCGFGGCDYKTDRMYNFKRHMFALHLKNDKLYNSGKKKKLNLSADLLRLLQTEPGEAPTLLADPLALP